MVRRVRVLPGFRVGGGVRRLRGLHGPGRGRGGRARRGDTDPYPCRCLVLLDDSHGHSYTRGVDSDPWQSGTPVAPGVVEQRLGRLAADVAGLAGLLRMEGERVCLLQRERGVVGLDPPSPRLAVDPRVRSLPYKVGR